MTADRKPAIPQGKLGLDPAEALMDHLGLPREAKYDFMDAALASTPPEFFEKFLTEEDPNEPSKQLKRPRVHWDTVQDALIVEFRDKTDYSKRELLDQRRFVDHDAEGNLSGVVLKGLSQGVEVGGLPEDRKISRMLRRRDITVIRPNRTARTTP